MLNLWSESNVDVDHWKETAIDLDSLLVQAQSAHDRKMFDQAATLCQTILTQNPDHSGALFLMGVVAARTGRLDLSAASHKAFLVQRPDHFDALVWLGIVTQRLGDFAESKLLFERALQINPLSYAPYVGLLRGKNMAESDLPLIESATVFFDSDDRVSDDRRQLAYAIGKAYDDLGEYAKAVRYFDTANQLAARVQKPNGFDRNLHTARLNRMIQGINPETLRKNSALGSQDCKPIFVLGMVRSGTTLAEHILSSHPAVVAGDEIKFWLQRGYSAFDSATDALNPMTLEELIWDYRALIERIGAKAAHVTDKMPLNYMLVGLIHLLFPKAPIVHCTRAPSDTCVSIYTTPYAAPPDFAFDWDDIAYAYAEYQRVMDYWIDLLPPGRMFELNYEKLTRAPEETMRPLIAYCGLEWNDACLNPQENRRAVDTPSRWQVRQPIYRDSVGRAEHYREWWPIEKLSPRPGR